MGTNSREIERKFSIPGHDLERFNHLIIWNTYAKFTQAGSGRDTYWSVPNREAAFVRVRERDGIRQLTVKEEDKGSSVDRVEIDLDCTAPVSAIMSYNNCLFGDPKGIIDKFYYVYELQPNTYLSIYKISVNGKPVPLVFMEVEGYDLNNVDYHVDKILTSLAPLCSDSFVETSGSLWTMYLKNV